MTKKNDHGTFHVPTRPYSPVQAANRRAAAVGSPGYVVRGASHADDYYKYNGHRVDVAHNAYRGYYVAEYHWGGERIVLRRGSFRKVLDAALEYHSRGALGSSVVVRLQADDHEAIEVASATPELVPGVEESLPWATWEHELAAGNVRDYCCPGALVRLYIPELTSECSSREEYEARLREQGKPVWV